MAKIQVLNYGCSANLAESEVIKGLLKRAGHEVTSNGEITILNLCTVKGDLSALRNVRKIYEKNQGNKVIITGCITNKLRELVKEKYPETSIMTTHQLSRVTEVVDRVVNDEIVELKLEKSEQKVNLPKIRTNPCVGIVIISNGCLSTCTYCSTKQVKGYLKSYSLQLIKKEVENCVKEGCKEIWLTSQDNGCWGFDINSNPGKLLRVVCDVEGEFFVRFGMASPQHVMKNIDSIIEAYKNTKMFKFLHVPVQSGSNKVLKDMRREYTVELYKELIAKFKKEIPEIRIATDIITGFPTESAEDFEKTIKLVKETLPDVVNISKFVARPGTIAARMKNLPSEVTKERTKQLTKVSREISREQLKKYLGWRGRVVVESQGKNNTVIARNAEYVPIVLQKGQVGEVINVEIVETRDHYCVGKKEKK